MIHATWFTVEFFKQRFLFFNGLSNYNAKRIYEIRLLCLQEYSLTDTNLCSIHYKFIEYISIKHIKIEKMYKFTIAHNKKDVLVSSC